MWRKQIAGEGGRRHAKEVERYRGRLKSETAREKEAKGSETQEEQARRGGKKGGGLTNSSSSNGRGRGGTVGGVLEMINGLYLIRMSQVGL